jgi:hypothetical protein
MRNNAGVGAVLDINTPDTVVVRDYATTGAGNLGLWSGGRLILDHDLDANNYIDATDIAVNIYVEGVLSAFFKTSGILLPNDKNVSLGTGSNYWHTYSTGASRYEFWTTNADGLGADGLVWSVVDGTDDLRVAANLVMTAGDIVMTSGQRILLDGVDDYISGTGGTIQLGVNNADIALVQAPGILMSNDKVLAFGGGYRYSMAWSSTATNWTLASSNIDGVGTPGTVITVEDGTDDVVFSGDVILQNAQNLYLYKGGTSGTYFRGNAVNGEIDVYLNNTLYEYMTFVTGRGHNLRQDYPIRFHSSMDSRIAAYELGYHTAGTQLRLLSLDIDGVGTDGPVLWVEDGTDTLSLGGNLELLTGSDILPSADTAPLVAIRGTTTGINIYNSAGSRVIGTVANGFVIAGNNIQVSSSAAGRITFTRLGNAFTLDCNTLDTMTVLSAAGTAAGNLDLWETGRLTFDADGAGASYLEYTAGALEFHGVGTKLYSGGVYVGSLAAAGTVFATLVDSKELRFGSAAPYHMIYDGPATRFEFNAANIDGLGTPGTVWSVANNTDDVKFEGQVKLNIDQGVVFDTDEDGDSSIYGGGGGAYLHFVHNGTGFMRYSPTIAEFTVTHIFRNDIPLGIGTNAPYSWVYASGSTRLELRSTDVDGVGTDGVVLLVQNGTDDVTFEGSAKLNVGQSVVFDADEGSENFIQTLIAGHMAYDTTGQHTFYLSGTQKLTIQASYVGLRNNIALTLGNSSNYGFIYDSTAT